MQALEHLNNFEMKNFLKTHRLHLDSMGKEQRSNYQLENIIKVERDFEQKCFIVQYDNGEWYHYSLKHDWY